MKLRASKRLMNIVPRIAAIVLAMLFVAGNLNFTNASGPSLTTAPQEETGPVHLPLATMGITLGQTARINVVCSPDPNSPNPPQPVTVELGVLLEIVSASGPRKNETH